MNARLLSATVAPVARIKGVMNGFNARIAGKFITKETDMFLLCLIDNDGYSFPVNVETAVLINEWYSLLRYDLLKGNL
jgi:hypothetical protein